jgi:hypothetical protein
MWRVIALRMKLESSTTKTLVAEYAAFPVSMWGLLLIARSSHRGRADAELVCDGCEAATPPAPLPSADRSCPTTVKKLQPKIVFS